MTRPAWIYAYFSMLFWGAYVATIKRIDEEARRY